MFNYVFMNVYNLLKIGNESSDVLNSDRVLNGELIALTLDSSALNEHSGIGGETGKSHRDVIVEHANLAHGSVVLEHGNGLLLDA